MRIRITRPSVLFLGGLWFWLVALAGYAAVVRPGLWILVFFGVLLLAWCVGVAHDLWFYYIEIDATEVRQCRYFGLGDKHLSLTSVRDVTSEHPRSLVGMRLTRVCVRSAEREICVTTDYYKRAELADLVRRLQDAGLRAQPSVLRALKML